MQIALELFTRVCNWKLIANSKLGHSLLKLLRLNFLTSKEIIEINKILKALYLFFTKHVSTIYSIKLTFYIQAN